jgi:sialate O-acetylesterase
LALQNVFECAKNATGTTTIGWNPYACGDIRQSTGYACSMALLIKSWREIWAVGTSTAAAFPFGLVSLAGGTSEGNEANIGAFRWAQTANYGIMPNPAMPNAFVAQAFDAGEPYVGPESICRRPYGASAAWACAPGKAEFTPMFMGGIHPRPKHVVGERLARGAMAHVYGDDTVGWTGPVFKGCTVNFGATHPPFCGHWIDIEFDSDLLGDDAYHVALESVKAS